MIILRLFKYFIIILCLLLSTIIVLATTNFGTRSLYKMVRLILPGDLTIQQMTGTLINHLELTDVVYVDKTHNKLAMKKFTFAWGFGESWQKIIIREMNIALFSYHLNPSAFSQALNGDINLHLKSHGDFDLFHPRNMNMQFHIQSIEGKFNQESIAGNIALIVNQGNFKIEDAQLTVGAAKANITGSLTDEWHIDWQLKIPELAAYAANIKGSLLSDGHISGKVNTPLIEGDLHSKDIYFADYFIPQVNCNFTAEINTSAINFKINNVNLSFPLLNTQIQNALVKGQYQKTQQKLLFHATVPTMPIKQNATLDDGIGKLNGTIEFAKPTLQADVHLSGQNLLLANTREYKVNVSPDIHFDYHANKTNLQGKISIPTAKITPHDFNATVSLPDDAVIIHKKASPDHASTSQTPLDANNSVNAKNSQLDMNLQIEVGESVYLDYAHVNARLAGNVNLKQEASGTMLATGELHTMQGKYQAYGQALTIEQGRIIYTGSVVTNPGIDIRASKTIKEIKTNNANDVVPATSRTQLSVGILATGTVAHPKISLYSNPQGLSQNDILSYLIFGYPQSKINDSNSLALLNHMLANLVTNAGGSGGSGITDKMKNMLGLAEFNVGTMDYMAGDNNNIENATVVSIGKKLGKKLFVQYTTGIFQPISILSLKYQINKRLALKSETSSIENGADLIYEIEKD